MKKKLDTKILEIIEQMCLVDPDGSIWGKDTCLGNIRGMTETIKRILRN